jgi:hypothetical protein
MGSLLPDTRLYIYTLQALRFGKTANFKVVCQEKLVFQNFSFGETSLLFRRRFPRFFSPDHFDGDGNGIVIPHSQGYRRNLGQIDDPVPGGGDTAGNSDVNMPVILQICNRHFGSQGKSRVGADQFVGSHSTGSGPSLAESPRIILVIVLGIKPRENQKQKKHANN